MRGKCEDNWWRNVFIALNWEIVGQGGFPIFYKYLGNVGRWVVFFMKFGATTISARDTTLFHKTVCDLWRLDANCWNAWGSKHSSHSRNCSHSKTWLQCWLEMIAAWGRLNQMMRYYCKDMTEMKESCPNLTPQLRVQFSGVKFYATTIKGMLKTFLFACVVWPRKMAINPARWDRWLQGSIRSIIQHEGMFVQFFYSSQHVRNMETLLPSKA